MGKICRVKQRTKTHKKRKGFLGVRKDVVNIVNTGINLSNVNSESIKDNLVNSNFNSTILPKCDNEQILNPQKLPTSSSKVQSIEVTPANKKEDISGNRIIDTNILIDTFVNFYVGCVNNVHWFLVKDMKNSNDLHYCRI